MTAPVSLNELAEHIRAAAAAGTALRLRGHGSKDFYGGMLSGEVLEVAGYRGVVAYEPTELYVTARCGTPLSEIEALVAERGQMLAFEPPRYASAAAPGGATLGGCVAAGLAGPRRQQAGAVRDFILGAKLVDGRGQVLNFGGQVMKNVAGYDVSRLLAGSQGTLGLIAEVSLKVLPRPVAEATLAFEMGQEEAITALNLWGGQPLPISASFWHGGRLFLRLAGARAAVAAAQARLGGEAVAEGVAFWDSVREQRHPAFAAPVLWRLALPTATPASLLAALPEPVAVEWGGGQRWLASADPGLDALAVRQAVMAADGHATLFRAPESLRCRVDAFTPLAPALGALHRRLKQAFDPRGIFNPGRLYAEL